LLGGRGAVTLAGGFGAAPALTRSRRSAGLLQAPLQQYARQLLQKAAARMQMRSAATSKLSVRAAKAAAEGAPRGERRQHLQQEPAGACARAHARGGMVLLRVSIAVAPAPSPFVGGGGAHAAP